MLTSPRTRLGVLSAALAAWGLGTALGGQSSDWPQWRGPNRDGVSHESGWLTAWPADGPRVLWRASVGAGFSSVAIADGRVYTLGNQSGTDFAYCLDAATGRVVWQHSYPCCQGSYRGPRATPTVSGGLVYTLSREGDLFCFRAATGEMV